MYERRLSWRLFVSYLTVTLLALVALAWYGSAIIDDALAHGLSGRLETTTQLLAQRIEPLLAENDVAAIRAMAQSANRIDGSRITVILPDGKVIADTRIDPERLENHADRPEIAEALSGKIGHSKRYSTSVAEQLLYVAAPIGRGDLVLGVVRASISRAQIYRQLRHYQVWLLSGVAIVGLVAAGLSWLLARRESRPVEAVAQAAQRLARGELHERLPSHHVAEVARLSEAINQAAAQLEERSHRLGRKGHEQEAVLASMIEGVLAVDSDERIISINRAAAELVGAQAAELAGRSLQEVIRNADLRRFATRALVSQESIEDDIVLRGEKERVLQIRGTALRDSRGRSIGAVIVLHDITHYRHLENIRRDFVANVSHELKTPIASIKGFVETLLDGGIHNQEDAERFLRIIAKQADRLNSIIEDLLSLSKIEQSEEEANLPLEPQSVKEILEAAVYDCLTKAADRSIEVNVSCDENAVANINARLLEQAVVNLLDNAIKYSEPGNEVLITCRLLDGEVVIAVSDHGCGIEKDHLPRLFERFYRVDRARSRKLGGTGLGLAIVKHIVLAHGGKVAVNSTAGKGSTFTIQLPAVKVSSPA